MGYFREVELGPSFAPFSAFRNYFGFVPAVFRSQSAAPGLIEAEAGLAATILFQPGALSHKQKERVLLAAAAAAHHVYPATLHYQTLAALGEPEERLDPLVSDYRQGGLPAEEVALLEFAARLGTAGDSISLRDVGALRAQGWSDAVVLETVLLTAWAALVGSLSIGMGVSPDFESVSLRTVPAFVPPAGTSDPATDAAGPYIAVPELEAGHFASYAFFREHFGFLPNLLRAQGSRQDVIRAEAEAIRLVLLTGNRLSRLQKEWILLVVSAANRNTYFVAVHSGILGALGVSTEDADRIACDHRRAGLGEADSALLDFALQLAADSPAFGAQDVAALRGHGFTDEQVVEAVGMIALTNFLNTVQFGIGARPDFAPRRIFRPGSSKVANPLAPANRPSEKGPMADPDAEAVAKVQGGDCDAFESLVNRHSRRVYRTLLAILGSPDEACDAMQDTFLKAFQHIGGFQRRSKFSTWLVSIAANTGLQLLRERKRLQRLDDDAIEPEEGFRPQQIRAWTDDPEQVYSKTEMRALIEQHVMKLPAKYRLVLMLRDIEQLSIEEASAALGLGVAALKSRHLRGRLMLREALTPHFAATAKGGTA